MTMLFSLKFHHISTQVHQKGVVNDFSCQQRVSTYQRGLKEYIKKDWENMDAIIQGTPTGKKLKIGGDLNGNINRKKIYGDCTKAFDMV